MHDLPATTEAPPFGARRLLLFGTGSLSVAFLPWWVTWLRTAYPALEVRTVVTRSAQRFVSRHALTALAGQAVPLDAWPDERDEPVPGPVHVDYASWPDAIAVYPATFHFLARFALGLADTPMLLALQTTAAVVGVAPAVPPGAVDSFTYRRHLAALARRPNTTVAGPVEGRSAHTRDRAIGTAAPLPVLLANLELVRRSAGGNHTGELRKDAIPWPG
ncbi:flavoprotein [Virgisporangium aurantiacum]